MYIAIKNEKIIGVYADNEREGLIDVDSIPEPEQKEGYIPVMYYRDGKIVYEYEPIPEMTVEEEHLIPEMTYEEQVVAKIRERYSVDDELAILRQRDTKPEEFEAYNAYAESCKEEAILLIEKQKH
ncbi:hypothetical protein [Barnesiella intestinihominis]|uniref:hypothetical protein n=1 Tax=Barnesiella intestinihominis TaxID=487174 RepID=UPI001896D7B8|nr:hypothetical protein [Barnesiella intestinihominis]MDB0676031.1 hypothetical protein [Barnesiella intestinihominis]